MNERAGLFRIIVRLDSAEEETDWGFQLNSGKDEFERTVKGSDIGTIIDMGPCCFNVARCTPREGEAQYPKMGDRIRFKQYTGYGFTTKEGEKEVHYAIINDDDYLTTIEESENE